MALWSRLKLVLPSQRRAMDRDTQEELESLASMAAPGELGNLTQAAENARAIRVWPWMDVLVQDLRYAARSMRNSRAFTAIAVATLALGIGANTAVFTQVNSIFLTELAVSKPGELRRLAWTSPKRAFAGKGMTLPMVDKNVAMGRPLLSFSFPAFSELQNASSFADLACIRFAMFNLPEAGPVRTRLVTGNYFNLLGVQALVGRTLTPEDDQPGQPLAAVMGWGLWQRAFGGDPSVVGRQLKVNQAPYTIVGVLPEEFFGLDATSPEDLTIAIRAATSSNPKRLEDPRDWTACSIVLGRLRGQTSDQQARAESELLLQRTILANPPAEPFELPKSILIDYARGEDGLRRNLSLPLMLLMAITAAVLLIACANIAGLLLARGTARGKEIATRLAVGASRGRIVRQLLTESLLLSAIGGALGIAVAYAMHPFLPQLLFHIGQLGSTGAGLGLQPRIDWRVLAFSGALTAITGILFGLLPALRSTRVELMSSMKQTNGALPGRLRFRSGQAVLGVQVSLAMVLLIGAGLLLRTLINLKSVPMGYQPENMLYFTADTDPRRPDLVESTVAKLAAIPGVAVASASIWPIFTSAPDTYMPVCIPGYTPKTLDDRYADSDLILPNFFETWGVPLRRGRFMEWQDVRGTERVAIINEAFVKQYLNGKDPADDIVQIGANCAPWRIIGVVADVTDRPRITPRPFVFMPYRNQRTHMTFAVRLTAAGVPVAAAMRQIMKELDTRIFEDLITGTEYRERTMHREDALAALLGLFSLLALLVASIGIYGMLAYAVNQRTAEIGIRMALGAPRASVIRMVTKDSITPVIIGIVVAIGTAYVLTRWIESLLFGVSKSDPWSIGGAAAAFLLTAAAASTIPAKRAVQIDPMRALRHE